MTKKYIVFFLMLLVVFPCIAQSPKRVIITLDVSGSMEGNKYVMANYAAQTISVLCDKDDVVDIYYLGQKHSLSGDDAYKTLHKAFNQLPASRKSYCEISDLQAVMRDFNPDQNYEDWLFIIGDGDWDWYGASKTYQTVTDDFVKFVESNNIHVCYLQTGNTLNENYGFTSFLDSLSSQKIEMRKSDTTASSVLRQCHAYANEILGFSNVSIDVLDSGDDCIEFKSDFPLDHFLIVYQDSQQIGKEPKVVSSAFGENEINFKEKGNPTTGPLVQAKASKLMGAIWEMTYPPTIPANETIKVCFDVKPKKEKLAVYPYVDVVVKVYPENSAMETLNELDDNLFAICQRENDFVAVMEFSDKHGNKFSPELVQKMDVKYLLGNVEKQATYEPSDTTFRCVMPMPYDTVSYQAKVESPGYFTRLCPIQTVVKTSVCPPDKVPLMTLPAQCFDPVSFNDLMEGETVGGIISDSLFRKVAEAGVFDKITLSCSDKVFFEKTDFGLSGFELDVTATPKGNWCECAFPDTIRYEVIMVSDNGIVLGDKCYEGFVLPVKIPVDKRSWFARCKWYVYLIGALLLLMFYFVALCRKCRFRKDSLVREFYVRPMFMGLAKEDPTPIPYKLRKKGFSHWLDRWLNPFSDEKRSMYFPNLKITLDFVADKNPASYLKVGKKSFDTQKMSTKDYAPNRFGNSAHEKDKCFRWGEGGNILVSGTANGRLVYVKGEKDDVASFKVFMAVLIAVCIAAICLLSYVLLHSF